MLADAVHCRRLSELLAGLVAPGAWPDADPVIGSVALDSRAVDAGALFLAYPGVRSHGLDHAEQAIARGAAAVAWDMTPDVTGDATAGAAALPVPAVRVPQLAAHASAIAARFHGQPAERLMTIGVTGTDGKTSCAWLLAQAMNAANMPCGYLGTLGYGMPGALAPATHTTPDAAALQAWLARFAAAGAAAAALEVSSHALAQHRVDGVVFHTAVLTQIGRDHLDYHGSQARYVAAKRRLFERPGLCFAVLNADDATGRAWLADLPAGVTPIAYGRDEPAAHAERYVHLCSITARVDGLALELQTERGGARLESRLLGEFNAMNLAAVLAVLLARGDTLEAAVAALARSDTVPGRMERVTARAEQPLVLVDYAHTPGALTAALTAARAHTRGKLLCVFGCGGERDTGKRAPMGAAAAELADAVWVTDDNPRCESPAAIVQDILAGMQRARVEVMHDRALAIEAAIRAAGPADVVLIAGKGHETTQQVAGESRVFDDRATARRVLEAA